MTAIFKTIRWAILRFVVQIAPTSVPQFQAIDAFVTAWITATPMSRSAVLQAAFTPTITTAAKVSASPVVEAFRLYGGIGRGFRIVADYWGAAERKEMAEILKANFAVEDIRPDPTIDDAAGAVIAIGTVLCVIPGDLQGTVEALIQHRSRT